MKLKVAAAIVVLGIASPCFAAKNLDNLQALTQDQFKSLSKDLGAALSYKPVSPAEPLGLLGFDIGLEVAATEVNNSDIWKLATSNSDIPSTLVLPKVHLILGLPFNIDVGAVYSSIPDTNINLLGGELRYAFVSGNTAMPAVAIRATMTKMSGVDQLSFTTKGLDLSISKGFAMLTPYAGIGEVWSDSKPDASTSLGNESFQQTKFYGGLNINLALVNFALEYDNTDSINTYSAKIGLRF